MIDLGYQDIHFTINGNDIDALVTYEGREDESRINVCGGFKASEIEHFIYEDNLHHKTSYVKFFLKNGNTLEFCNLKCEILEKVVNLSDVSYQTTRTREAKR